MNKLYINVLIQWNQLMKRDLFIFLLNSFLEWISWWNLPRNSSVRTDRYAHDLSLVKGNLDYDTWNGNSIAFILIGSNQKLIFVKEFYDQILKEMQNTKGN